DSSSVSVRPSRSKSWSSMWRRVGSASALKTWAESMSPILCDQKVTCQDLQVARGLDQDVDVSQLARLVGPRAAHDSVGVEQKRGARGDVAHPVVLVLDAEAVGRFGVPVGEEREVEVEGLHPRDV